MSDGEDHREHARGNRAKHESRNPAQRWLIDRFHGAVVQAVRDLAPKTVLDLGCGEGYTLQALLDAGVEAEYTGIDLNRAALEDARARLGERVQLECADARNLAADGRKFDLVMMLEVLEHIPYPAPMLGVLEALTRRDLLLSVPREPFFMGLNFLRGKNLRRWGNDPEHINHWGRRAFHRFVGERFELLRSPAVFPWTMVVARRRS